MTNKLFDNFVNEQTKVAKEEHFDKNKELAQWLEYVRTFYESIEHFLDRYIKEKTVKLEYKKQPMHEDFSGPYEIDALTVVVGANRIQFKPIGTMLIGAKGRIDMTGPRGMVRFLLVNKELSAPKISVRVWIDGQEPPPEEQPKPVVEWAWKISTPPPRIKYTEFGEESFYTAMMEVANG